MTTAYVADRHRRDWRYTAKFSNAVWQ